MTLCRRVQQDRHPTPAATVCREGYHLDVSSEFSMLSQLTTTAPHSAVPPRVVALDLDVDPS